MPTCTPPPDRKRRVRGMLSAETARDGLPVLRSARDAVVSSGRAFRGSRYRRAVAGSSGCRPALSSARRSWVGSSSEGRRSADQIPGSLRSRNQSLSSWRCLLQVCADDWCRTSLRRSSRD